MELKHNFYGVNFAPFPRRGVLNSETAHRSMTAMVEAAADGNGWFDTTELASALDVFEALYNDHIVLEESLAYPEASKRLAQTDTSGMGREMAARRARLKKEG